MKIKSDKDLKSLKKKKKQKIHLEVLIFQLAAILDYN